MVMDETFVINQMKEDVCYVSDDFYRDMKTAKYVVYRHFCVRLLSAAESYVYVLKIVFCCRLRGKDNTIAKDYVLPDYTHIKRGYVRSILEEPEKSGSAQVLILQKSSFIDRLNSRMVTQLTPNRVTN